MYKLGTLEQFNTEDAVAKKVAGWTNLEIKNGKEFTIEEESFISTKLLSVKQNPNGSDEYLWESESGDIEDTFNILAIWNKSIKVDTTRCVKYVIYNNDGEYICTKVEPNSCLNFGFKVTDIEIFDAKEDCLLRAEELEISLEEAL